MSATSRGKRGERPPCRCCFLGCEYKVTSVRGGSYPCSNELRLWVRAHRNDVGDELGYVRERVRT